MSNDTMDPNYIWPLVLLTDLCAPSQARLIGLIQTTLEDDLKSHSSDYFAASFQAQNIIQEVKVHA
ncbi:uncharacterized protein N7479_006109 [Penicillium vulpinum]|uniref:uncharacterized protein n=1 Tax=Penicillium vulpinum TaxID=29845 RepID=UPI002546DEA9|nr:uncharacterized protein N7479_006109 [Penicillium vulpinum]KAJ5958959.1 hypothetical protein N7479_006109 [Penicillium vulpinum]